MKLQLERRANIGVTLERIRRPARWTAWASVLQGSRIRLLLRQSPLDFIWLRQKRCILKFSVPARIELLWRQSPLELRHKLGEQTGRHSPPEFSASIRSHLAVNPTIRLSTGSAAAPSRRAAGAPGGCTFLIDRRASNIAISSTLAATDSTQTIQTQSTRLRAALLSPAPPNGRSSQSQPYGTSPVRWAPEVPRIRLAAHPAKRSRDKSGEPAQSRFRFVPLGRLAGTVRQPIDAGATAVQMRVCQSTRRHEPRWIAPPPMVQKAARVAPSNRRAEVPVEQEFRATGWPADSPDFTRNPVSRSGSQAAFSQVNVESLTEQVISQIDRRIRAKRERLGKV